MATDFPAIEQYDGDYDAEAAEEWAARSLNQVDIHLTVDQRIAAASAWALLAISQRLGRLTSGLSELDETLEGKI